MRTCQANLNVSMEKPRSKTSQTILKKKYKVELVQFDCKVLFDKGQINYTLINLTLKK